jgi:hypothetical protein
MKKKKYPCNGPRQEIQAKYYKGMIRAKEFLPHCEQRTGILQPATHIGEQKIETIHLNDNE